MVKSTVADKIEVLNIFSALMHTKEDTEDTENEPQMTSREEPLTQNGSSNNNFNKISRDTDIEGEEGTQGKSPSGEAFNNKIVDKPPNISP